jgi:outer membrane receptor protein involved in Fe transport
VRHVFLATSGGFAIACAIGAPQIASAQERRIIALPAQPLARSLQELGRTFGRNVSVDARVVRGRTGRALSGPLTFEEAVAALLAGTGLSAAAVSDGVVIAADAGAQDSGIVVTGSRIRGAASPSVTLRYDRESMRDAGQASLADVVRTIPQNFGGGQNVGIGTNVPESRGADLDGGSSINLRGLGSDATLTLLDGRRMSYAGALQSIDVSAIPFGAVERIEIVPDGASALFGSDAVAGVANIILRRGFNGLETSARLGGSTDGGNFQQQYAVTAGRAWASGSVMASYEFAHTTEITAQQRSYARDRVPGVTLFPFLKHHNAALVIRQELGPNVTFDLDGLINKRWHAFALPLNAAGDLAVSRGDYFRTALSWAIAPSLTVSLPHDWQVVAGGSYGWSRTSLGSTYTYPTTTITGATAAYRNVTQSVELSGNGKLVEVPAGSVKAAVGLGYRRNLFRRTSSRASAYMNASQQSYYAFGELSVPVLSPGMRSPIGYKLDLSLAGRYENYPGIASVLTPKLGAIYAPSPDLAIHASWGRSFRTPTLYEQYVPSSAYLDPEAYYGGTGSGTVIYVQGGNPNLRPERSTNWSATLDLHPRAIEGAQLEISYFAIDYRDRIVTPILYTAQGLTNAAYVDYVTRDPSEEAQAAVLADVGTFTNYTSAAYDPASVVAIIDNSNVNAGRQTIRGVDLLGRYNFALGTGKVSVSLNTSYIQSSQKIGSGQAATKLAGMLFNPPHWRARAEVGWNGDALSAHAALSYIGPVRDARYDPAVIVGGMVPLDCTLRYRSTAATGVFSGLDLTLALENAFNDKPSTIVTTAYTQAPYDSTNYSPFGRVVSVTVSKKW